MAIKGGVIAKKMLGFADEIVEGASKGIGDAGTIKQVNKIVSNMTPGQQKNTAKYALQTGTRRVAGIQKPTLGNKIGDSFAGGIKDTYTSVKNGETVSQALTNGFVDPSSGKLRMGRVAGTFVGASAAARVATGGGLYKDRYGSGNIIGVPFI